jgi:hypothetical protein
MKPQFSFDMPANTTVDTKGSISILAKTTGHEKQRISVVLSVLADGRELIKFVVMKRKKLSKGKLPTEIIFKCNEKGLMMEEHIYAIYQFHYLGSVLCPSNSGNAK